MKKLLSSFLILVVCASAHAELSIYAQVGCDVSKGALTVAELRTEEESSLVRPPGTETISMDSLVKIVTGDLGDYAIKYREWKSECLLGGARYQVQIAPWKYNAKINGFCGGGSPSVRVTIKRNGNDLLSDLVFSGSCDGTWNEGFLIGGITLYESQRQAEFVVENAADDSGRLMLSYARLVGLTRPGLWAAYQQNPTKRSSGRAKTHAAER